LVHVSNAVAFFAHNGAHSQGHTSAATGLTAPQCGQSRGLRPVSSAARLAACMAAKSICRPVPSQCGQLSRAMPGRQRQRAPVNKAVICFPSRLELDFRTYAPICARQWPPHAHGVRRLSCGEYPAQREPGCRAGRRAERSSRTAPKWSDIR
jgi:hypothetical protein